MIDPDGILTMEYVRKRLASRDVETPEAMALRSLIILRLKIDTMTASAATLRDDIDVAMIAFGRGDVTTAEHRALSSCIDAASSIERAKSSSINAGARFLLRGRCSVRARGCGFRASLRGSSSDIFSATVCR